MAEQFSIQEVFEGIVALLRGFGYVILALVAGWLGLEIYRSNKLSTFDVEFAPTVKTINIENYCRESSAYYIIGLSSTSRIGLWIGKIESRSRTYSLSQDAVSAELAFTRFNASGDGPAASQAKSAAKFRWNQAFESYMESLCYELEEKSRTY